MSASTWQPFLVGVVSSRASQLWFPPPGDPFHSGKVDDPHEVRALANRLDRFGFDPAEPANHVNGAVSEESLAAIKASLRMPAAKLRETAFKSENPLLDAKLRIFCFHEESRLLVKALEFLGKTDVILTVRLHHFPEGTRQREDLVRSEAYRFRPSIQCSGGEICRNALKAWRSGEHGLSRSWQSRLDQSGSKTDCFAVLMSHTETVDALCALLDLPGLWRGLKLGNWLKIRAARCDEMVVMYLTHMHRIWSEAILGGDGRLGSVVDSTTVGILQGLAPSACTADRDHVREAMRSGRLFPEIKGHDVRRGLEERITSVEGLIPSFDLFHKNMGYLCVAADILKVHFRVFKTPNPTESHAPAQTGEMSQPRRTPTSFGEVAAGRRTTLYSAFRDLWDPTQTPVIEEREGEFVSPVAGASAELSFLGLLLIAWRHFPFLSTVRPLLQGRGDQIEAHVHPGRVQGLFRRARLLGFRNQSIEASLEAEQHDFGQPYLGRRRSALVEWRCGRPPIQTFLELQDVCFLPVLSQPCGQCHIPTPSFVLQDLIRAFFGTFRFDINAAESPVNVDSRAVTEPSVALSADSDVEMSTAKPATSKKVAKKVAKRPIEAPRDHSYRMTKAKKRAVRAQSLSARGVRPSEGAVALSVDNGVKMPTAKPATGKKVATKLAKRRIEAPRDHSYRITKKRAVRAQSLSARGVRPSNLKGAVALSADNGVKMPTAKSAKGKRIARKPAMRPIEGARDKSSVRLPDDPADEQGEDMPMRLMVGVAQSQLVHPAEPTPEASPRSIRSVMNSPTAPLGDSAAEPNAYFGLADTNAREEQQVTTEFETVPLTPDRQTSSIMGFSPPSDNEEPRSP